ncbi:hypothetical protein HG531_003013 [Fusarium graminearum]|nr:hypothetical protein HG531_003013 [Fusarium graminearum]
MLLLEDEHSLGLSQELITLGAVKSNKGSLALTTKVLNLAWVLLAKTLKVLEKLVTNLCGVVDEIVLVDLINDGLEEDSASRVTHPCVELTVRLVGTNGRVSIVETGGLGLLREGHNIRGALEVPVLMSPELACSANTSLDLVHDKENVVLLGQSAQLAEKVRRGVVVTALALDGLDNDGAGRVVPALNKVLNLIDTSLLDLLVLLNILLERVLELGEGSLRPVESRDIDLVNCLGSGCGKRSKETAVETSLEGKDREVGTTGRLVVHGTIELLGAKVDIRTTSLLLSAPHESGFVGSLVGVGTSHGSEDVIQALRGNTEKT